MDVVEMMKHMKKAAGNDENSLASMAAGDVAKRMLEGFSILRLVSLASGFLNIENTKEQLLEWNAKLNKIKKKD